jgi:penicillin-binding protein 2
MALNVHPPAEQPAAAPAARVAEVAPSAPGDDTSRLAVIRGAIVALLLILLGGLAYRQLGYAEEYAALERRQTHRGVMMPVPRGIIYDRDHRVLAGYRTRIAAVLNLGELRHEFAEDERLLLEKSEALRGTESSAPRRSDITGGRARFIVVQRHHQRVNAIIGRHADLDAARLDRHIARERTVPFVLVDDLTADESTRLAAALNDSDPVELQRFHDRWYPYKNAAAHVVGRLRRETILTPKGEDFPILNYIGTVGDFGMEKQLDARLQGRPGEAVIRVDAFGFPVGAPFERREGTPGEDVVLSIDIDLQIAAERAMAATPGVPRGAAVAIKISTGEVLVMASKPDFDLNAVSPSLSAAMKQQIDSEGGWFNRATQGLYPPGSSFKVFTALAGLRRGTLLPDELFRCAGFHPVAGHRFLCHNPSGHGDVSLRTGLAHSCNVFAYVTGLAAGPEALAAEARRFHLGEPTGVDLPFETEEMLVPDPAQKQNEGGGSWTTGDTINLAIGQGDLRYSPLQAACAIASLARRETLTVPTLLHQPNGRRPSGERPPERLDVSESHYAAVIDGMRAVVEIGIGRDAQVPGVSIAGKTGTAQVLRPEGMMNVAWFIAFAPCERPEIAIAVAMEGDQPGVEFAGAAHAAPIVREIIGTYFDKK